MIDQGGWGTPRRGCFSGGFRAFRRVPPCLPDAASPQVRAGRQGQGGVRENSLTVPAPP